MQWKSEKRPADKPERKDYQHELPKVNEWTGKPFSPRFYQILEKRKELPAWQAYQQVIDLVT
jgi:pre-mRNA-splicing factor ATP-dependent RNA helicase DHX15/PRP43